MQSNNQKIYTSLIRPVKYNGFVKEVLFSVNGDELYLYKKCCYNRNKVRKTAKPLGVDEARKYISYISRLNPFYYMALSDIKKGIDELKNDFPDFSEVGQTFDNNMENNSLPINLESDCGPSA